MNLSPHLSVSFIGNFFSGSNITVIENTEAPQEVVVQPPEVVGTKGSGSRLPSRVEKALKLKSKPLRQCKKCQEWGHHDSRNCDKFKEKEKRRSRRNSEV
ncbi:hypothetical protein SASPL_129424 [Salvia splendens]|uniref:Uncharacterized protein n=1 Tax=Salvia splendens TaxID=180675 RepID=A0A8X8ZPF4_SALSN|nr:hypothetical protein SASPL_129424 [Salvia splendens]